MADRLQQLKDMLDARTDSEGSPKRGFAQNVLHLRSEIDRLERATATAARTSNESGSGQG